MNLKQTWKQWLAAGVLVGAVALTGATIFPQITFAQTDDSSGDSAATPATPLDCGGMMFGMRGFDRGEMRGEHQAYLADALGITVEELQAAQQQAQQAMIDAAVEAGAITQEQADLMAARRAFMQYYAAERGQSFADALSAAVEAGAITQEQADLLEAQGQMGRGMFGGGMFGGGMRGGDRGGQFHHRGMMPGDGSQMPGRNNRTTPNTQTPTATPEANS
jgi:hypothetical protein